MYTIKSNIFDDLNVMIMENTSIMTNPLNKKMIFDMKGSTEQRKSSFPLKYRQFWHKTLNYSKTMKDMNFVEINKYTGNSLIDLNDIEIEKINEIIQNDQRFLT